MRLLAKEDHTLASAVKDARRLSSVRSRQRQHAPRRAKVRERARLGSLAVTLAPPFWAWQWDAETGSASGTESVDGNAGTMSYDAWTGDNGKAASSRVALGGYFQPFADNGIMDISANPAISYDAETWTVLDSAHAGGFVGLYVGEYTLQGEFEQAVIDQQIDVTSVAGGGQGSTSGYPLFGSTPVDSNHFYEIWVWAGGDAEADGWSLFWGSAALSYGNLSVPSISVYAY
ncbi:MAG TPA: hypothetical protein VLX85_07380 [Stellaceae bacterium]|nr:hypothetical protein [Stellaceae bacterium]